MKRTPNEQQLKAINSIGGVCLSAGAGSGKTFVIVEKLLKIIESKKIELFDIDENLMRSKVRKFLGKLVVMTFTKKAAGELNTRVVRRIEEEFSEAGDLFYKVVKEEVNSIYIGTIHGFCFRLLRQGVFPGVNPDIKIISEESRRIQVLKLVKNFGENRVESYDNDLKKLFFSSFDQISEGIYSVISDPEQRGAWDDNIKSDDDIFIENKSFWRRLCEVENLDLLLRKFSTHHEYSSESNKTWHKAIEKFNNLDALSLNDDVKTQECLNQFFGEFKRIVKPKKIDSNEIHLYLDQIAELRKLFKKYYDEIEFFNKNKEPHFKKYYDFFRDIYKHVSSSLLFVSELTFSDLEYLTLKELRSEQVKDDEIKKMFSFFIIDEFQDTSNVQFKIIEKLCLEKFENLFVVGDEKQAIYRFRGGEISLFSHVKTLLKNNLTLTDNYRSLAPIISFNNDFSKKTFPLGPGFKGVDRFSLVPDGQTIPEFKLGGDQEQKVIHLVQKKLDEGVKLSKQEIEKAEVEMAYLHLRSFSESEGVCFLYSKLTPVYFLIETFIRENVSFQAQVKIPFRDNPVLSLIYAALMGVLSKDSEKSRTKFNLSSWIIGNILKSIKSNGVDEDLIENYLFDFERDYLYYDFQTALKKLFFHLGINNPDVENNIQIVSELNKQLDGNLEQVFNFLQEKQGSTYSFEYQFGSGSNPVRVMSVHASKGLEFDHVFVLGGMTNGVTRSMDSLLGKKVGSFRWKTSFKDIKFQRSPEYILESHEEKFQDFSEQKRLIYVAFTRAVKSLSLLKIVDSNLEPISVGKNSWVNSYDKVDSSHFNMKSSDLDLIDNERESRHYKLPFFQRDNFGLTVNNNHHSNLVVSTEMSVTQLSDLALCSRYFYLKHIVKLNEDDISLFDDVSNQLPANYHLPYKTARDESRSGHDSSKSDAQRGTYIHGLLEKFIDSKGKKEFFFNKLEDELAFNFGKEIIAPYINSDEHTLLSERELKFDLYTQKISAKPDLVILPRNNFSRSVEIWDFKTGEINEFNRDKYLFQLYLYAKGVSQLFPEHTQFTVKIICLDYQKVEQKTLDYTELTKTISNTLKGMNQPEMKNPDYCSQCELNKVCLIGHGSESTSPF